MPASIESRAAGRYLAPPTARSRHGRGAIEADVDAERRGLRISPLPPTRPPPNMSLASWRPLPCGQSVAAKETRRCRAAAARGAGTGPAATLGRRFAVSASRPRGLSADRHDGEVRMRSRKPSIAARSRPAARAGGVDESAPASPGADAAGNRAIRGLPALGTQLGEILGRSVQRHRGISAPRAGCRCRRIDQHAARRGAGRALQPLRLSASMGGSRHLCAPARRRRSGSGRGGLSSTRPWRQTRPLLFMRPRPLRGVCRRRPAAVVGDLHAGLGIEQCRHELRALVWDFDRPGLEGLARTTDRRRLRRSPRRGMRIGSRLDGPSRFSAARASSTVALRRVLTLRSTGGGVRGLRICEAPRLAEAPGGCGPHPFTET